MNKQTIINTFERESFVPMQSITEAEKRQAILDAEKAEYFARGGKIVECKSCTMAQPVYLRNEFSGVNDAKTRAKGRANSKPRQRATINSKSYPTAHDYIYRSDVDQTKFVTIVGAFISAQFNTISLAISCRDFKLSGR